jgi:hypothetical protein
MNHHAFKLDPWPARQRIGIGIGANAGDAVAAMARCGPPERRSACSKLATAPRRQNPAFRYRYLSTAMLTLSTALTAAPADRFAWRWPLRLNAHADLHQLTLSPEIYGSLYRQDLGDLLLFDVDGAAVTFGPMPPDPEPPWQHTPWLLRMDALFQQPITPPNDLTLAPEQYAVRLVARLHSQVPAGTPIIGLRLQWTDANGIGPAPQFRLAATPAGGTLWPSTVQSQQFDRALGQGETRLQVSAISASDFVLLIEPVRSSLRLTSVLAEYQSDPDADADQQLIELRPTHFADQTAHDFGYLLAGGFPVSGAEFDLGAAGNLSALTLLSRDRDQPWWQLQGSTTAFAMQVDKATLKQNRLYFPPTRQRQWLLQSQPPLKQAPRIRLRYRPDRFLIAHGGPADLVLVGGNRDVQRPHYPVPAVIQAMQAQLGRSWTPPSASLGARVRVRGAAALLPPPPAPPYRQWVLWAVLVIAAAAVATMAGSLLRQSKTPGPR